MNFGPTDSLFLSKLITEYVFFAHSLQFESESEITSKTLFRTLQLLTSSSSARNILKLPGAHFSSSRVSSPNEFFLSRGVSKAKSNANSNSNSNSKFALLHNDPFSKPVNEITVQQADPSSFESHQIIALDEIKSAILLAKILSKNKIRLLLTTFLVNSVFANALHGENIDLIQCLEEAEIENLSALTKVRFVDDIVDTDEIDSGEYTKVEVIENRLSGEKYSVLILAPRVNFLSQSQSQSQTKSKSKSKSMLSTEIIPQLILRAHSVGLLDQLATTVRRAFNCVCYWLSSGSFDTIPGNGHPEQVMKDLFGEIAKSLEDGNFDTSFLKICEVQQQKGNFTANVQSVCFRCLQSAIEFPLIARAGGTRRKYLLDQKIKKPLPTTIQPLNLTIDLVSSLANSLSLLLRVDSLVHIVKNSEVRNKTILSKKNTFGIIGDLDGDGDSDLDELGVRLD
ncbi:hypothetical protein ScalyP_jg3220 [Parmales sp. scaly parma]|nr:hypothetical protein ScalyP_jg3220 [Parmales sp. scaly parma]